MHAYGMRTAAAAAPRPPGKRLFYYIIEAANRLAVRGELLQ